MGQRRAAPVSLYGLLPAVQVLVDGYGVYRKRSFVIAGRSQQPRHLLAARKAPRGPEIDQHVRRLQAAPRRFLALSVGQTEADDGIPAAIRDRRFVFVCIRGVVRVRNRGTRRGYREFESGFFFDRVRVRERIAYDAGITVECLAALGRHRGYGFTGRSRSRKHRKIRIVGEFCTDICVCLGLFALRQIRQKIEAGIYRIEPASGGPQQLPPQQPFGAEAGVDTCCECCTAVVVGRQIQRFGLQPFAQCYDRSPEDAAQLLLGFGPRYLRTAHPPQRRECEVYPVAASDDDRAGRERYAFDENLGRHFVERNPPLQHETPAANPAGIDEGRLIVEIGEQISCAALGIETVGDRTRYADGRRMLPADVDCRKQKKQINKWMFHNGSF